MKKIAMLLFSLLMTALCFSFVSYADETQSETKAEVKITEVDTVRLEFYYSGEIEVESDTKGVDVDKVSGSKKVKNDWTTITVRVSADDGYEFKRLNRQSAWKLRTDTSDLRVKFEAATYDDNEAKVKIKYYYRDETVKKNSSSNNRSSNSSSYFPYEVSRYYDGWQKQSGYWYFYKNGYKVTNNWEYIGGKWYYFDSYGHMKTGWIKFNDVYYTDPLTGKTVKGNLYYYTDSSGAMVTGWQYIGKDWYYFTATGEMVRGWAFDESLNAWFFLDSEGKMLKGWHKINDVVRYFKEDSPGQGMLLN